MEWLPGGLAIHGTFHGAYWKIFPNHFEGPTRDRAQVRPIALRPSVLFVTVAPLVLG